ncbi:YCF48-related protein [Patescibacteria group bacterium]
MKKAKFVFLDSKELQKTGKKIKKAIKKSPFKCIACLAIFAVVLLTAAFFTSPFTGRAIWEDKSPLGVSVNLNGVDFVSSSTGWVVGDDDLGTEIVYKTINGGDSWAAQTAALAASIDFNDISMFDANNGVLVGDTDLSRGAVFYTSNGGTTWTQSTDADIPMYNLNGVHMVSSTVGWVVGDSFNALKTTDGGVNWSTETLPLIIGSPDLQDELAATTTVATIVGNTSGARGAILHTTDGGTGWVEQTDGDIPLENLHGIYMPSTTTAYVVGESNGTRGTILKAASLPTDAWTISTDADITDEHLYAVDGISTTNVWTTGTINLAGGGATEGTLLHTTDGSDWAVETADVSAVNFFGLSAIDDINIWISGASGTINKYSDTTAPSVSLTPIADPTNDTTPTFTGSATDTESNISSVEYLVENLTTPGSPSWEAASITAGSGTPNVNYEFTTAELSYDQYKVSVRATDAESNTTASENYGTQTFDVEDPNPPSVSLTPIATPTSDSTPTFTGSATDGESNIQSVEYKVDTLVGAPIVDWTAASITSGGGTPSVDYEFTTAELSIEEYEVSVRATDVESNTTLEIDYATQEFEIIAPDTTPPTVTINAITTPTTDNTPTFTGAASDSESNIASVEYRVENLELMDLGDWTAASITAGAGTQDVEYELTTAALEYDEYRIDVRATDVEGNPTQSENYATQEFEVVDLTPPVASLDAFASPTVDTTPTFTGDVSDAKTNVVSVEYRIDSGSWQTATITLGEGSKDVSYELTTSDLVFGDYTLYIRATDAEGNTIIVNNYATKQFTVTGDDSISPTVTIETVGGIGADSDEITVSLSPTIEGYATDSLSKIVKVEYKINSGSWQTATIDPEEGAAQVDFSFNTGVLGEGRNTIYIRATDASGNVTEGDDYATVSFGTDPDIDDPGSSASIVDGEEIKVTSLVPTGADLSLWVILGLFSGLMIFSVL